MKVAALDLPQHLARGVKALYAVHGVEPLAALEAADLIRAAARSSGASERQVFTAETGFDWSQLAAASASLSLFASRRLIELRIPTGKPGAEGSKAIAALAASASGDDVTLITFPELDWQAQKTEWFQALESHGVLVEAAPVLRAALPLAGQRLQQQQQTLDPEGLEWLADQVEGNLLAALQEVQKLALLLPPGAIDREQLEGAVTNVARYEGDDLISAIHAGDLARISRAVEALKAEAGPLPLLIWQIGNEAREALAIARRGRPTRPYPPARVRQLEALARRHSEARLARLIVQAHQLDRLMKGVGDLLTGSDPWSALAELAFRLSGRATLKPLPV